MNEHGRSWKIIAVNGKCEGRRKEMERREAGKG